MSDKSDILVLGATGFTGSLITRYLAAHPQQSQFTLALGARSPQKLRKLIDDLNLPASVRAVHVDVTKPDEVDAAVKGTRVVINTVGPYWTWGTPVVRSCVRHGVHYVDLTGETTWIYKIINEFDYYATKTKAIIVPSSGYDSIPSDITAYLANKTLKSLGPTSSGEYLEPGESLGAHKISGGVSGGTIASMMTLFESTPQNIRRLSSKPYSISPIMGLCAPLRLLYNLAIPGGKTINGAFFVMAPSNKAIVQRTYGLHALQHIQKKDLTSSLLTYGAKFTYDEFMATPGPITAVLLAVGLVVGMSMMMTGPIRRFLNKYLPQSGSGPSDDTMKHGFLKLTNITSAASDPSIKVKTVLTGKGDPGYLLTTVMISESALCLLLPPVSSGKKSPKDNVHALPELAQGGGVLTPMTAFGDQLIQRLQESGRFEISSTIVGPESTHHK